MRTVNRSAPLLRRALRAAAACIALAPPAEHADAAGRPDIVLVTIDTLRVDRVGAYGSTRGATTNLDALARQGVVMEDAVVQVPLTRPSHASLFTGRLPFEHGIRDNASAPLSREVPTLASVLRSAGYETAGFIAAFPVARSSGLDSGFDHFDDPFGGDADFLAGAGARNERPAREVVDAALAWLRNRPSTPARPKLVWVHVFEPHYPYEPPAPFAARFRSAPYDGVVAAADAEIGRLLTALPAGPDRVVAITADHGEGLGDHGEDEHHLFVYDTTLKVPMILAGGGIAAGRRVSGQFRSIDLMPTLLELAGVKAPNTSGLSRLTFMKSGGRIPDNDSYAESLYGSIHFGYAPVRALRREGFKFIDLPRPELFRVATDPNELTNLVAAREGVGRGMREALRAIHGESFTTTPALPPPDPETQERLAALGYVGPSAPSRESSGRAGAQAPDPKDRAAAYHRYARAVNRALTARRRGDRAAVIATLSPIAREFGDKYSVVAYLGEALLESSRFVEALPHLQKARDLAPRAGPSWGRLAEALAGAGRSADALEATTRGLAVSPKSVDLLRLRAAFFVREGKSREALSFLEAAFERDPQAGALAGEIASIRRNGGDLRGADEWSARALTLAAENGDVWLSRGLTLAALGRLDDAAAALKQARALSPKNVEAWFYSSAVAANRGDEAAAREFLSRAAGIDPKFPGLASARAALSGVPASPVAEAETASEVSLSIIRVRTRAEAENAKERLAKGESFAAVARAVSIDPTASVGGLLGRVRLSDLQLALRAVASRLAPGAASPPVETAGSFVILFRDR